MAPGAAPAWPCPLVVVGVFFFFSLLVAAFFSFSVRSDPVLCLLALVQAEPPFFEARGGRWASCKGAEEGTASFCFCFSFGLGFCFLRTLPLGFWFGCRGVPPRGFGLPERSPGRAGRLWGWSERVGIDGMAASMACRTALMVLLLVLPGLGVPLLLPARVGALGRRRARRDRGRSRGWGCLGSRPAGEAAPDRRFVGDDAEREEPDKDERLEDVLVVEHMLPVGEREVLVCGGVFPPETLRESREATTAGGELTIPAWSTSETGLCTGDRGRRGSL